MLQPRLEEIRCRGAWQRFAVSRTHVNELAHIVEWHTLAPHRINTAEIFKRWLRTMIKAQLREYAFQNWIGKNQVFHLGPNKIA